MTTTVNPGLPGKGFDKRKSQMNEEKETTNHNIRMTLQGTNIHQYLIKLDFTEKYGLG